MLLKFYSNCPFDMHCLKSNAQGKSRPLPTQIAALTGGITVADAHGARSRCPCEIGCVAPQYVEAELGLVAGGEGGGLVGEAESRQSWQGRHFCKGKRDWFEGI